MKNRQKRSNLWFIEKEILENVVKQSNSLTQILKYFGFSNKGGNSKTLKKRLIEDKIDFSHIKLTKASNLGKPGTKKKKDINLILVQSSDYSRHSLKQRLIEEKIIEYECNECKIKDSWNGKKLVLQLEHKNGISDDNRIENLCFLCPNCHSQTETYCGKNKKYIRNIYYCYCGNQKSKKASSCRKCKDKNKSKKPKKEILEKLVLQKSLTAIAKDYNVSSNTIKKWCVSYDIETKNKGFWLKKI
jgi:hypothetical protein